MTAIALQSLNFSGKILEKILNSIKASLRSMMIGYMVGRQKQANRMIAQQLICEYREVGHTVESLTAELDRKTLSSYTK
jgi:hypothetical protein